MHLVAIPIGLVLTYAVCRALGWRRAWSILAAGFVVVLLAMANRRPDEH